MNCLKIYLTAIILWYVCDSFFFFATERITYFFPHNIYWNVQNACCIVSCKVTIVVAVIFDASLNAIQRKSYNWKWWWLFVNEIQCWLICFGKTYIILMVIKAFIQISSWNCFSCHLSGCILFFYETNIIEKMR